MTPRVRLGSPGEIAAVLPHLTGFVPHESLLLVGLTGPRQRIGLTTRVDLAQARDGLEACVAAVRDSRARACIVAVVTQTATGSSHPYADLVQQCSERLRGAGLAVPDALLVRDGRWWSYRCSDACCPPEGTPVETGSPAVLTTAAHAAYAGQAVLGSREELVASLQPQLPLGPSLVRRLQQQALDALLVRRASARAPTVVEELARWRGALDAWHATPVAPPPDEVAALVAALHLHAVRDRVAGWTVADRESLLGLLTGLCRAAAAPHDAPLLALLAAAAYGGGNGALALVALERALASDPQCPLALLLLAALDHHLPPEQVRAALRAA